MAQKAEIAITSLKINHFHPNLDHKRVSGGGNCRMADPTQNTAIG